MRMTSQKSFYKDSVYRFFTQDINVYCDFDLDELTVSDADSIFDTACDVLALVNENYAASNDAIPLVCWSVLLNILVEEDLYDSFVSGVCNGFAMYLNSDSFKKMTSSDCDNCFPVEIYQACIDSVTSLQRKIDNPGQLLKQIISESTHVIH